MDEDNSFFYPSDASGGLKSKALRFTALLRPPSLGICRPRKNLSLEKVTQSEYVTIPANRTRFLAKAMWRATTSPFQVSSTSSLPESDHEDDRASIPLSGQPSPDAPPEAREREDSVGLLSPPSPQPSPRALLADAKVPSR